MKSGSSGTLGPMNRFLSIIVAGTIMLAPALTTPVFGQVSRTSGQVSPELTNAILGGSRPVQLRNTSAAPTTSGLRLQSNPVIQSSGVRPDQRKAKPADRTQVADVTTLQSNKPLPSTVQQPAFQPFRLGGSELIGKVGVSRFPKLAQAQPTLKFEPAVQEQPGSRESQKSATRYDGLNPENSQPASQLGDAEQQNAPDSPTELNPAPARPVVSTALPANFGANSLARPSTGIPRTGSSASIRGPGPPRRASGIPRSPNILPAGGRRSAASRPRGGCGG